MKQLAIFLFILMLFYFGRFFYFKPKIGQHEKAYPFNAISINGDKIAISDYLGKYVLLDFWASWCGPCRQENPQLVNLYQEFKNKNFEIIQIGLEYNNEQSWRRAIEKDNLSWPIHIFQNNGFKSQLAEQYGIREIPSKFLISPEGNILLVKPSIEEIRKVLKEKLN